MIMVHAFTTFDKNDVLIEKTIIAKVGDIKNYQLFANKKALEKHRRQLVESKKIKSVYFSYIEK